MPKYRKLPSIKDIRRNRINNSSKSDSDKLPEEFLGFTIEEVIGISNNQIVDYMVDSLNICKYDPFEFFDGMLTVVKKEYFEKIGSIDPMEILESKKISPVKKDQFRAWLDDYTEYIMHQRQQATNIQWYSTKKEQLYILHLLVENNYFNMYDLSEDMSSLSNIFSLFFNRGKETFYQELRSFDKHNIYKNIGIKSLIKIRDVFKESKVESLIPIIEKHIELAKEFKTKQ